jgi:hypothetical protein
MKTIYEALSLVFGTVQKGDANQRDVDKETGSVSQEKAALRTCGLVLELNCMRRCSWGNDLCVIRSLNDEAHLGGLGVGQNHVG